MYRIMLVCAGGMSTSLLMNKMKEAASKKGIEIDIWATAQSDAHNHYEHCDCVLVGPQIRFAHKKMEQEIQGRFPIEVVPMSDYGSMNGAKILDQAIHMIESFHA